MWSAGGAGIEWMGERMNEPATEQAASGPAAKAAARAGCGGASMGHGRGGL